MAMGSMYKILCSLCGSTWCFGYASRHTDTHTNMPVAILHTPSGGKVITLPCKLSPLCAVWDLVSVYRNDLTTMAAGITLNKSAKRSIFQYVLQIPPPGRISRLEPLVNTEHVISVRNQVTPTFPFQTSWPHMSQQLAIQTTARVLQLSVNNAKLVNYAETDTLNTLLLVPQCHTIITTITTTYLFHRCQQRLVEQMFFTGNTPSHHPNNSIKTLQNSQQ